MVTGQEQGGTVYNPRESKRTAAQIRKPVSGPLPSFALHFLSFNLLIYKTHVWANCTEPFVMSLKRDKIPVMVYNSGVEPS